jgi:hypothetical protein
MMRKSLCLSVLLTLYAAPAFAALPSGEDIRVHGLFSNFSLSYDRTLDGRASSLYVTLFDMWLPSSKYWTPHIGLMLQVPFGISIFDFYNVIGITVYPFKELFSVTGEFGFSLSSVTLNHFAYEAAVRANVDLPLFRRSSNHYLSFGSGFRRRDGIAIFNYLGISGPYYYVYHTFFFELAYRIKY